MDHKNLCCLCCRQGPISALAHIPKGGFVPGEVAFFSAEVENQSRRVMSKTQLRLMQKVNNYRKTRQY